MVDSTYITQLKLQKIEEGDITLHHIYIMAMCSREISSSFFYFCSFSCVIYV